MERFEKSGIFYSKFVVNERPYCLWDWQLPRANLEFIDDIDSFPFRKRKDIWNSIIYDLTIDAVKEFYYKF